MFVQVICNDSSLIYLSMAFEAYIKFRTRENHLCTWIVKMITSIKFRHIFYGLRDVQGCLKQMSKLETLGLDRAPTYLGSRYNHNRQPLMPHT